MRLSILFILTCLTLNLLGQVDVQKTRTIGIYLKTGVAKKVYKRDNANSKPKPVITASVMYHSDISNNIQFRGGFGVAYVLINERDYSPKFGSDWDSLTGTVDHMKSYFDQTSRSLNINLPINVRFKIMGESNHLYISPGMTLVQSVSFEKDLYLGETGVSKRLLTEGNFYKHRKTNFAFTIEIGYEFITSETRKMNVSFSMMRNMKSENIGISSALGNIIEGKAIQINIGFGIVI